MSYPNIEAIAFGTLSGYFSNWPLLRPEAKALLAEVGSLRAQVQEQRVQLDDRLSPAGAAALRADLAKQAEDLGRLAAAFAAALRIWKQTDTPADRALVRAMLHAAAVSEGLTGPADPR